VPHAGTPLPSPSNDTRIATGGGAAAAPGAHLPAARRPRARRGHPLFALLGAALLACVPAVLPAQINGGLDTEPPTITISPGTSSYGVDTVRVTVTWRDDVALNASSRSITLNGVPVDTAFTYGGSSKLATSTGRVRLGSGSNVLQASVEDAAGNVGAPVQVTYTYTYTAPPVQPPTPTYQVSVSPASQAVVRPVTYYTSETFTVSNPGNTDATYALQAICSGAALYCSTSQPQVSVPAGGSTVVAVVYAPGSPAGSTGVVSLKAWNAGNAAVTATGSYALTTDTMAFRGRQGMPTTRRRLDRDRCAIVSAGAGAALECGDLRLAHGLPGVRLLNRAAAPALIYSSQHAAPYPVVAAYVQLTGATRPDTVRAALVVNGATYTGKWPGWATDSLRRVAVGFDASALNAGLTGVQPYTFTVVGTFNNGSPTQTLSSTASELVVVNRRASPYGAGWWVAGLEQLVPLAGQRWMWVGGDGSHHVYGQVNDSTWVADQYDRPDTLKLRGDRLVRLLPAHAEVRYRLSGHHSETVDALGRTTTFIWNYDGSRLNSILLPVAGYAYSFTYGNNGGTRLSAVTSPGPNGALTTAVTTDASGRVTQVTDPDARWVGYGYAGADWRVTTRRDRRNNTTRYTYGEGSKLTSARIPAAVGDTLVTTFRPEEGQGIAFATSEFSTLVDGPRPGTGDQMYFVLDVLGVPYRINRPIEGDFAMYRTDPRFPGVVTRMDFANGRSLSASYDDRGNLLAVSDLSVSNGVWMATTTYQWDRGCDMPTRVTRPEGDFTLRAYTPLCQTAWVQPGADPARRVVFGYNPASHATAPGLPASVTSPTAAGSAPAVETVDYDARGNPHASRSALGFYTLTYGDAIGRDTLVITPADSATAQDSTALRATGVRARTVYDVNGRPVLSQTTGPATGYLRLHDGGPRFRPAQTLSVRNAYDDGGLLLRTDRWSSPDPAQVDTVTTRWRYDLAGRRVAEIAPGAPGAAESRDSTVYDAAGNVVRAINRRGFAIDMVYDDAGRLVQRTIPAAPLVPGDVELFTYDRMGNLRSASNAAAVVRRGYAPNGALLADTLQVADAAGTLGSQHVYVTAYQYDFNGRRTGMTVPEAVAPSSGQRQFTYAYDGTTGALRSVTEPLGNAFTFAQRLDGAMDTLRLPGALETYRYDADGRMVRRTRGTIGASAALYADSLLYSPRGKTLLAVTLRDSTRMTYDGLGHLVHSGTWDWHSTSANQREEEYTADALGNTLAHRRVTYSLTGSAQAQEADSTVYAYQRWTGRHLSSIFAPTTRAYLPYGPRDDVLNTWDAAGNLSTRIDSTSLKLGFGANTNGHPGNTAPDPDAGTSGNSAVQGMVAGYRYRADGRLMEVTRDAGCLLSLDASSAVCTNQVPDYLKQDRTETYRYDALGRRVYVRTVTPMGGLGQCAWRCDNTTRRTVWDGDRVLAEIRYPNGQADQDTGLDSLNQAAVAKRAATPTTLGNHPYGGPNTSNWAQSGRVLYVHAGGIDQPLGLLRMDYGMDFTAPTLVVPHANWRGAYEMGTFAFGETSNCRGVWMPANEVVQHDSSGHMAYPAEGSTADVYQDRCMEIDFPGKHMGMTRLLNRPTVAGPVAWMGSLVQDAQDASGLMYRRNRFYDPISSRFTQEDPIGLAGGVNGYGFAEGDPVNYGDPYGLCSKRQRDKDGKCPGGLSVGEWRAIEAASNVMRSDVRTHVRRMLRDGDIHSGRPFSGSDVLAVTNPTTGDITINNSYRGRSLFNSPTVDLALLVTHEMKHTRDFRLFGFATGVAAGWAAYVSNWVLSGFSYSRMSLEISADRFACSVVTGAKQASQATSYGC